MHGRTGCLAFAAVVLQAVVSCGGPDVGVSLQEQMHAGIYGGEPAVEPYHAAVVGIHQRYGDYVSISPFCSGTLLSDRVVLTAAHCLDVAAGGRTPVTIDPSEVAVYFGDEAATDPNPIAYAVEDTLIHPAYSRYSHTSDIAVLRLSVGPGSDVAAPVAHLPADLGLRDADVGALTLNFAGFGEIEDGSYGVKLAADGLLGGLGCSVYGCPTPGNASVQLSYDQGSGGPCFGDSGGPAFVVRGSEVYVAGVTSYGDGDCTVYGVSTRVDAFDNWLTAYLGAP